MLLGMGNPLLDISAVVDQAFLDKYEVKLNNAILAEDKHLEIYNDMIKNYTVDYVAGGATQNSIRVAQWMLKSEVAATSFIGCVGKDSYSEQLTKCAQNDGVNVQYLVDEKTPTGTCAVLVKDGERSLIANLAAANNYKVDHLEKEGIKALWEDATFYYMAGFFATVSQDTILKIAKHSLENKKTFSMNLSAPFICALGMLDNAMPYIDLLFGNESEAEAFGKQKNFDDCSASAVAAKLSELPREDKDRPRIVVITQGADPTLVAIEGKVTEYPTAPLDPKAIVDANGAGDAFVGGFLAHYMQGKDMSVCVAAGQWSARQILQTAGCAFSGKCEYSEE